MNGTLVGASPVGSEKVLRHHEYYISGGDVVFRVRTLQHAARIYTAFADLTLFVHLGWQLPFPRTPILLHAGVRILPRASAAGDEPGGFYKGLER